MPRLSTGAGYLLALTLLRAYGADTESKKVSSVEIFGAKAEIPLETKAGQVLDPAKLRNDIKTLWRSGRYSDIRAESVTDGDAVRVVFRVQQKRSIRLRKVTVTPPTPGIDLKLVPDSEIDSLGAQQIGASVRKQLETSGFPFAKVTSRLLPVGAGQADLEVKIDQGKQVKIREIVVTGDLGARGGGARKALRWTKSTTILPAIPGVWNGWRMLPGYSENAVQYDLANLRSFFYTRGYFDANIKSDGTDIQAGSVDPKRGTARLEYLVHAGPRYAIRQLNLLGANGERQIAPEPDAGFPARQMCNELLAERRIAEQAGILDFSARIEIRDIPEEPLTEGPDARKWADLTATVQRGPVYRVGRIEFRGNRTFSDQTVRRTFLLNEDDLFDETLLRKSLVRLNDTGLFETLTESSVIINTPPGSDRADLTVHLKEKKMRHWFLSGPVGPMSLAGPLQFAIGTRLPSWGQNLLELSTYTAALNLMLLPKPLGGIIPGLPNRRFLVALTIQRPPLPGQRFLSGFTVAPQFGWQGILTSYGFSQTRGLLGGVFEDKRQYTPALAVTVSHIGPNGPDSSREGTLYCEPPKPRLNWLRITGGTASKLVFSLTPF